MTPEQAIQNLESLINVSLQRGLFQTTQEVLVMSESLEVLRKKEGTPINGLGEVLTGNQSKYVTTTTADIKDN